MSETNHSVPVTVIGVFMILIGIWSLISPQTVGSMLALQTDGISGFNEIRANYGGMFVGFGIFFFYCAKRSGFHSLAWLLFGLMCGGLASARLLSMLLEGMPGPVHLFALAIESLCAVVSVIVLRGSAEAKQVQTG